MGASKRTTLPPIEEHRHAKLCDSSGFKVDEGSSAGVAAGSLQKSKSGSSGGAVLRPLVKLKKAFVELMVSNRDTLPGGATATAAYFSMGVVMGPVHFGGYEAVSHYMARDYDYESR